MEIQNTVIQMPFSLNLNHSVLCHQSLLNAESNKMHSCKKKLITLVQVRAILGCVLSRYSNAWQNSTAFCISDVYGE